MKKIIIVLVIIAVVGGLGYMGTQSQGRFDHHSVMEEIHHIEHENSAHGTEDGGLLQNDLDTTEFMKVHSKDSKIKSFFTQFRTEQIISFPCQNCHNTPLSQMASTSINGKKAHWDVEITHATATVMSCTTCHNSDNMNYLNSLAGDPISIDRSFEVCGQCHSTQLKDWQGGAHGKNLNGWKPPRVVKTCVNCHNPHNPAIKSRWPSRLVNQDKTTLE